LLKGDGFPRGPAAAGRTGRSQLGYHRSSGKAARTVLWLIDDDLVPILLFDYDVDERSSCALQHSAATLLS
jgi:hypothetical protein